MHGKGGRGLHPAQPLAQGRLAQAKLLAHSLLGMPGVHEVYGLLP
jgi:hypothetical protein